MRTRQRKRIELTNFLPVHARSEQTIQSRCGLQLIEAYVKTAVNGISVRQLSMRKYDLCAAV